MVNIVHLKNVPKGASPRYEEVTLLSKANGKVDWGDPMTEVSQTAWLILRDTLFIQMSSRHLNK